MTIPDVRILADERELSEAAARSAVADLEAAVEHHGSATWMLTGGSTPMAAYQLLARHDLRTAIEWELVRVGMGDERSVPLSDPDSNWRQASSALLDHVPLPEANRLRMKGELSPEEAAEDYERVIRELPATESGAPRIELMWLGVGDDGHCLSLMPGHPEIEVRDRLVVPVHNSPNPPPDRVSLTLAALAGVERLTVEAAGESKADAIGRALAGEAELPISRAVATVLDAGGHVTWLLDEAAASKRRG